MTETTENAQEKCRAVKHGVVDLQCRLPEGHDKPQDGNPGTWHESILTERREIDYDGAHHLIVHTETVTWEPSDHIGEAVRLIMAGRGERAVTGRARAGRELACAEDREADEIAAEDDPEAREEAEFLADAASLDADFRESR